MCRSYAPACWISELHRQACTTKHLANLGQSNASQAIKECNQHNHKEHRHGWMQPLATRTQFVPLASDKSKAVTHKSPSVGLQNTNNTCYMNSFVQGLFWRDAFLWRIHNFNLKLKNNPSKMDKEKYEFGKVVELLNSNSQRWSSWSRNSQICDSGISCRHSLQTIYLRQQQDVTETMRFVFAKLGGSDQQLLKEVFAGQPHETTMQRVWRGHISTPFALSSHVADLQRHFRIVRVSEETLQISWFLYGSIEARRSAKVSFRTL